MRRARGGAKTGRVTDSVAEGRRGRGQDLVVSTVLFAALYAVAMYAGRATHLPPSQLSLAWPAAGVAVVWFLQLRRTRERLLALGAITLVSGLINASTGVEPLGGWLFGPVNASQGWVGAAVLVALRDRGRAQPTASFRNILALGAASVAGAAVSALTGGVVASWRFGAELWEGIWLIGFRNALSAFVVTAALLAVPRLRRVGRLDPIGATALVLALVMTVGLMAVSWPLAFAVVPPLLLVALRCGTEITAVTVALQGVIVVAATHAGIGPFAELETVRSQVLIAQLFVLVLAVLGLVVAVQERSREDALRQARHYGDRLRHHMEAALVAAGHLVVDQRGRVHTDAVNAALEALTERSRSDLVGTDPATWMTPDDVAVLREGIGALADGPDIGWRGQLLLAPEWGGAWVDVALALVDRDRDGGATWLKLQMVDITAQKEAEGLLAHAALHDELTGLANRTLWADRLDRAVLEIQRSGSLAGVMYVDIDHFKQINDTYGHPVGDEVLKEVARRIGALVRPGDTVARIGGDELVVLCPDLATERDGHALAERIQRSLQAPVVAGDRLVAVTASIGVAFASAEDIDPRLLLRHADIALYTAKERGRARFEIYTPALHAGVERSARLLLDLERGHRAGELSMVYQPIVDADTGQIVALEALLRWNHPERGCLRPGDFLDVLENSELVHRVGDEALRRACRDSAELVRRGWPTTMHVNVSAKELAKNGLVERVRQALEDADLPADLLVLEITETRLVAVNGSLVRDLFALRDLGVRIAADDFGTGFSTLTHLVDLPVDIVKLDGSFVADIGTSRSARSVSSGIRAMAEGLEIEAVAEGVETAEQVRILRGLGYHLLQGYHLGRPRGIEEIIDEQDLFAVG